MKKLEFVTLVLIFVVSATTSGFGEEINKDFHKSFDVKEGVALHLKHGDGDVTIIPWDKDIVDIEVHYRAERKHFGVGGKVQFDVEFRQTGSVIHVIERERVSASVGYVNFKRYEYTYDIRAPHYVILDLEGEDGDIDIRNWRAEIQCVLEDGDIELVDLASPRTQIEIEDGNVNVDNLDGELIIDTEDGDIEINRCKAKRCRIRLEDGDLTVRQSEGDFEIDVEDGDVNLFQLRVNVLEIRASDGDVDLELLKSDNVDVDISTEDGDVSVDLESGISASFSIDTDGGRIRVIVPGAEYVTKKEHRASGELHGGKGRIRIDTSDGNVTLRESD